MLASLFQFFFFLLTVRPFYPQSTCETGYLSPSTSLSLSLPLLTLLSCSSSSLLYCGRVLTTITCCASQHKLMSTNSHASSPASRTKSDLAAGLAALPVSVDALANTQPEVIVTISLNSLSYGRLSCGSTWQEDSRFWT